MPKHSTEDQLARRVAIVGVLPRLPSNGPAQGMTVEQVMARLRQSHQVDRRTFERDLKELGDEHGEWRRLGLEVIGRRSERDGRVKEWFTTANSRIPLFKSLTPMDALVASFARQELGPFLPQEARQSLDEQLGTIEEKARHLQMTSEYQQVGAYKDKIRRLPDGTPMQSSKVNPAHLQTVNDALMHNTMLRLMYRAAKDDRLKQHLVCPVGLLIHDRSLRLLAVESAQLSLPPSSMVIKSFLLHRVHEATGADPVARNVRVPTLDDAISGGALKMWSRGAISLRLQFAAGEDASVFARTLEEMPLADDQEIFRNSDGQLELTASVADTSSLRRMLRSMAREVKVLAPASLRQDIREFLVAGLAFQQADET